MEHEHLLLCDGSSFDTTRYVQLAELFPNGKLPDLNGRFLQGATTAGQMIEAGLPNITGAMNAQGSVSYVARTGDNGAFRSAGPLNKQSAAITNQSTGGITMTFDASRSSAVYGKSNTVQPPAYLVHFWVRTA